MAVLLVKVEKYNMAFSQHVSHNRLGMLDCLWPRLYFLCIVLYFRCEKFLFFLPHTSQIDFPAFFMNNARTTTPATPTLPQEKEKNEAKPSDNKTATLADLAQVTRLYDLGLISKEQVQKIVSQVCPDNKKGAD